MEDRYIACMVLHALGDTIGYNNSKWEFMPNTNNNMWDKVWEKVNQFVHYGGINHIPGKDWIISDDTIMHMKVAEALLSKYTTFNDLGKVFKQKFIDAFDQFHKEGFELRHPGITLINNINKLKEMKWDELEYDFDYGGSGASMRSSCIGLAYHGVKNRDKLIQVSIESSRITHNSTTGYLGGLTSALFTAYAIEGVSLKEWPFKLVELLEGNTIKEYIISTKRGVAEYHRDHHVFLKKWKRYIDDRFDDNNEPVVRRSSRNLAWRSQYYTSVFGDERKKNIAIPGYSGNDATRDLVFPGSGGDDSVIIAYDCLFDAKDNWEMLVFYAMMHSGDTDTTGCIAGSWYGALYGFGDVPTQVISNLSSKDDITKLGKSLYKKYASA